jgi:protein CpxP
MPTKFRFSTLATLFALTAGLLFAGQKSQAPQTPPASGQSAMGATASTPEAHLQMLSEKLKLTDDQKAKLRPILQDQEKQLKAVHDDSSLSQEQKIAKKKAIHESFHEQINAELTPEQQAKFKEMKHEGIEKHHQ